MYLLGRYWECSFCTLFIIVKYYFQRSHWGSWCICIVDERTFLFAHLIEINIFLKIYFQSLYTDTFKALSQPRKSNISHPKKTPVGNIPFVDALDMKTCAPTGSQILSIASEHSKWGLLTRVTNLDELITTELLLINANSEMDHSGEEIHWVILSVVGTPLLSTLGLGSESIHINE